jgi:hypothetical protein
MRKTKLLARLKAGRWAAVETADSGTGRFVGCEPLWEGPFSRSDAALNQRLKTFWIV